MPSSTVTSGEPRVRHHLDERLRQELRGLRTGDRFPSQPELARRFAVSQGTVREALSVLVQQGLLQQKRGSGTYVAAPPRREIGLVTGLDIAQPGLSPFWLQTIQAFRQQFAAHGLGTRIYIGHAGPAVTSSEAATGREFWDDIAAHRLAGVVVVNSPTPRQWITDLAATGLPVHQLGQESAPPTMTDHAAMLAAGVRHLLTRGRRRLAMLDVAPRALWTSAGYAAVREALALGGVCVPPEWQVSFAFPLAGFEGFQGVMRLWQARAEKPDGLLIGQDVLLPAATSALQELRMRLPEELLIVAHTVRHAPPPALPMARLEVDPAEHAARCVALLLADLKLASPPPVPEFLPFRLIAETSEVTRFPVPASQFPVVPSPPLTCGRQPLMAKCPSKESWS